MKRKILAIVTGLFIVAGSVQFSLQQARSGDNPGLSAKNAEALASSYCVQCNYQFAEHCNSLGGTVIGYWCRDFKVSGPSKEQ